MNVHLVSDITSRSELESEVNVEPRNSIAHNLVHLELATTKDQVPAGKHFNFADWFNPQFPRHKTNCGSLIDTLPLNLYPERVRVQYLRLIL